MMWIRRPKVNVPAWCPKAAKVAHDSKSAAWAHIRSLEQGDKTEPNTMHPYRCMSHWHVGHTRKASA